MRASRAALGVALVVALGAAGPARGAPGDPDSAATPATRALALSDRAVEAAQAGRFGEAESLLEQASRLANALPADDPDAPFILANRAQLLLSSGRWEAAEAVAIAAGRRAEAAGHPGLRVRAGRVVAEARRLQHRLDEADEALQRTLAIAGSAPSDPEAGELAFTAALLALDRGRPQEALRQLRPLVPAAPAPASGDLARRARLARAEALEALGRDATEEWRRAESEAAGDLERADVWQRRAWTASRTGNHTGAAAAADAMLERVAAWIADAADPVDRAERCRIARGFVETAIVARLAGADRGTWPGAVAWIRRIAGRGPRSADGKETNARATVWFWGADLVVAVDDADGDAASLRVCGSSERLREWILLFRSLLASPERAEERERTGTWLVDALFAGPPPTDRTLRLEPDGPLAALPFAALPTPAGPLGLACALVRGARPAGSAPAGEEPRDTLILADPAPAPGAPTSPLPGARREAFAIASRLPGARVLLGEDAAESRVAGTSPSTVLHVAAHSSANPDHPALFLAPGGGRDGRLTPDEVRRLPRVPRVVVLSSCESLLTDVTGRSSSGAVAQAFLEAGAGCVVGALWSVEDRALGPLMASFHAEIARGVRPSEAMRRARVAAVAARDPGVSDPFAWAAFTVLGRDEPVRFVAPEPERDRGPEAAVGYVSVLGFGVLLAFTRRRGRASDSPT